MKRILKWTLGFLIVNSFVWAVGQANHAFQDIS
jgi:hypothetical protein